MKLKVLQLLKERLNGQCGRSYKKCPQFIDRYEFNFYDSDGEWCYWCQNNFYWLHQSDIEPEDLCPCLLQTEEGAVIQHLNDIVQQLKSKQQKGIRNNA